MEGGPKMGSGPVKYFSFRLEWLVHITSWYTGFLFGSNDREDTLSGNKIKSTSDGMMTSLGGNISISVGLSRSVPTLDFLGLGGFGYTYCLQEGRESAKEENTLKPPAESK